MRLLRGILVRMTEKSGLADVPELPTLLKALTHLTLTAPGFIGDGSSERLAQPEDELISLIFQSDRVGSLAYNYRRIHRSAGSVRDRISMDMWRVLSSLPPEDGFDAADPPTLSDVLDLLNQRVLILAGFGGIAMESMTRGHAWRFLDMGRKIERRTHDWVVAVDAGYGPMAEDRAAPCTVAARPANSRAEEQARSSAAGNRNSSMTYRRRYLGSVQAAGVLDY